VIHHSTPLVLGSGSPRRREILQTLSIPIRVIPGQADEDVHEAEAPATYLCRVVLEKLRDVADRLDGGPFGGLLVADTVVLLDDHILGKPTDEADASRMLRGLSGRAHEVHTRFAIARPEHPTQPVHEETVRTVVTFRALSDDEIARYAASGEGLDKAGAYAAQGLGSFAVERIEGSYPNVVGLPACEVVVALRRAGLLQAYPP
jgi:septum formation protein